MCIIIYTIKNDVVAADIWEPKRVLKLKPWPRPMALAFQKVRPRPKPTQAKTLAWLGFWLQAKASTALK